MSKYEQDLTNIVKKYKQDGTVDLSSFLLKLFLSGMSIEGITVVKQLIINFLKQTDNKNITNIKVNSVQ